MKKFTVKQMNTIKRLTTSCFILLFLFLFSCKNVEKDYYENGNIKSIKNYNSKGEKDGEFVEFYSNGILKEKKFYKKGFLIDSILMFDKRGNIEMTIHFTKDSTLHVVKMYDSLSNVVSKGFVKDDKKIGDWKYFKNQKLVGEDHFFNLGKKGVKLNQQRVFEDGEIVNNKSFYYNIKSDDTVFVDAPNIFSVDYNFREDSLEYGEDKFIYLLTSSKINEDFSNLNEVKVDTFAPINLGRINGKFIFQTKGEKYLRGIIEKHSIIEEHDSIRVEVSKMYFEKKIYVKDTVYDPPEFQKEING